MARLVGVLLLAAAGAKLYGWNYQPTSETAWLAIPSVRAATIISEGLLGLWLLIGIAREGSWLASLAAFTCFAVVSARSGWLGLASCGCFGAATVSPWFSFTLDVTVLILLGVLRPLDGLGWRRQTLLWIVKGLVGVAVLAVVALGLGRFFFSSPQEAIAFLGGDRVTLGQSIIDLGAGQNGEWKTAQVVVHNRSAQPIQIVGGHSNCTCAVAEDLPITIGAGEKAQVPVRIQYPASSSGEFWKEVQLLTDNSAQGSLEVILSGRVVPDQ
jgi:hypothetical protein